MNLSIVAIVVGILSCISNTVLTGITIAGLISFSQQDHSRPLASIFDDSIFAFTIISLIFYVIMFALSILMIVGVQKKRQEWIGPWIILSAIDIVCTIIYVSILAFVAPIRHIIVRQAYIAISVLVWYPIFTLWRNMRNATVNSVSQKSQSASAPEYDPIPVYSAKEEPKQRDYIPNTQTA